MSNLLSLSFFVLNWWDLLSVSLHSSTTQKKSQWLSEHASSSKQAWGSQSESSSGRESWVIQKTCKTQFLKVLLFWILLEVYLSSIWACFSCQSSASCSFWHFFALDVGIFAFSNIHLCATCAVRKAFPMASYRCWIISVKNETCWIPQSVQVHRRVASKGHLFREELSGSFFSCM